MRVRRAVFVFASAFVDSLVAVSRRARKRQILSPPRSFAIKRGFGCQNYFRSTKKVQQPFISYSLTASA